MSIVVTAKDGSEWIFQKCGWCNTHIKYPKYAKNVGCHICHSVYNVTADNKKPTPRKPS